MNRIKLEIQKIFSIFIIGGLIYLFFEVLFGTVFDPAGYKSYRNLMSMFILGGILTVILGYLDEINWFRKLPVKVKAIIGGIIITIGEFLVGYLVNIIFKWNNWDYSHLPGGELFLGQICPLFTLIWIFLSPFAYWVDNSYRIIHKTIIEIEDKVEQNKLISECRYYLIRFEYLLERYKILLTCWGKEIWRQ